MTEPAKVRYLPDRWLASRRVLAYIREVSVSTIRRQHEAVACDVETRAELYEVPRHTPPDGP